MQGFFGKLHTHASAIARKSNFQRMDERRRQFGAEYGHDIRNHIAPPTKEWRQTWCCTRRRRHAAEIAARTCQWLKKECKPYEGRKVKEAKEFRPSQSEWKAMQLQPETLQKYKQVHGVAKQEEQIRDSIRQCTERCSVEDRRENRHNPCRFPARV